MARKLEAGEFSLALKAVDPRLDTQSPFADDETIDDNIMRIRGIASGTGIDLHDDIMAQSAIESFKEAIEKGITLENGEWSLIPLRSGHRNNWDDILGWITKADIDENYNLWIEAELDDSSRARDLYNKLTQPTKTGRVTQLGFSIGGKIRKYRTHYDAILQKTLRILESIDLGEVSVVGAPAYPTAYVEAILKSLERLPEDTVEDMNMADNDKELGVIDVATTHDAGGDEVVTGNEEQPDVIVQIPDENNVPHEDVDPATTARVDPSVNAPDIVPSVDEQDAAEESGDTDESEEASEANADPNADVRESLAAITAAVAALAARLDNAPVEEEDVNKSLVETDVTTSAPAFDMDAIKALIETAVTDAVTKITDDLTVVKSALEDIAATPLDGSLSVVKAKERQDDDPLSIFKSNASREGFDKNHIIAEAVRAAYASN